MGNPQEQTTAILERLKRYVGFETPTGDPDALADLAAVIRGDFEALGATASVDEHPTGDHLVLDFPGIGRRRDDKPLLFLAHHDTVWPKGQLERMPLVLEGDTLRGPGSYDMKAGLAIFHEALTLLGRHDLERGPIRLIVVADEEIGSPTARALIEAQVGHVSCAIGLEPPHTGGELKTSRWGSTRVRLSVVGKEAHAALAPETGISAIDELVDQLLNIRLLMRGYPSVLCNFGTVSGGGRTNVVAGTAYAEIGLRFKDAATEKVVLASLLATEPIRPGAVLTVELLSNRPAWAAGESHDALFADAVKAAKAVGQTLEGRAATGAADTNLTGGSGIPSLDGLGASGCGAHAVDEQVHIPSLAPRAQLLAAIMHTL
ncbi:M20/M25/M40 family metallo-hydrolase [Paenarthrobacter sp. OM7]|uniref:M20/M25/M40 family metallo-hydrolase n=1 Tax=Paenarthrobacter sp. OM7 TaxID=3041264 RepID=UPI002468EFD0|nr:M20/M25/M40 family metallo-hydrolase [Paenarthrobacter sp. OM7]WGM20452.1 M20/M25/M40 family metallo-hydrolase [Paenarthrobacter sp. OM7]